MKRIAIVIVAMLAIVACAAPTQTDMALDAAVAELAAERGTPQRVEMLTDYDPYVAVVYWPEDLVVLTFESGEWVRCEPCIVIIAEGV